MQSPRALECFLLGRERSWQPQQYTRLDFKFIFNSRKLLTNSFNGSFAADAATRGSKNVTCQLSEIQGFRLSQPHIDQVALGLRNRRVSARIVGDVTPPVQRGRFSFTLRITRSGLAFR